MDCCQALSETEGRRSLVGVDYLSGPLSSKATNTEPLTIRY